MFSRDCHSAELCAAFIIDSLLSHCAQKLYEDYLDSKVQSFVLGELLGQVAAGLEMEFIRRDVGDSAFKQDGEMKPPQADSWTPFHVTTRKSAKLPLGASSPPSRDSRASTYRPALLPRPQPYPLEWAVEKPDPELDRLRELKACEELQRKADAERTRQLQAQREAETKRLEKISAELKKSQFTYDYEGRILLVKPQPLPEVQQVGYSIPVDPPPQQVKAQLTPRPVKAAKKTPAVELQFVKSLNAVPNIMDLLKLNPGVTAIDSSRARRGPESPQKTMTRDDYRRLTGEEVSPPTSHHFSKSPPFRRKLLADIPDSDQGDIAQYKSAPNLLSTEKFTEVDKFNMEIMNAPDWGLNTPQFAHQTLGPIPEKPSPKITHATHGVKVRRPRERPFQDRKLARQHLPPPRAGKTMGHGMVDPRYL